jgi:hypothetical protein
MIYLYSKNQNLNLFLYKWISRRDLRVTQLTEYVNLRINLWQIQKIREYSKYHPKVSIALYSAMTLVNIIVFNPLSSLTTALEHTALAAKEIYLGIFKDRRKAKRHFGNAGIRTVMAVFYTATAGFTPLFAAIGSYELSKFFIQNPHRASVASELKLKLNDQRMQAYSLYRNKDRFFIDACFAALEGKLDALIVAKDNIDAVPFGQKEYAETRKHISDSLPHLNQEKKSFKEYTMSLTNRQGFLSAKETWENLVHLHVRNNPKEMTSHSVTHTMKFYKPL